MNEMLIQIKITNQVSKYKISADADIVTIKQAIAELE